MVTLPKQAQFLGLPRATTPEKRRAPAFMSRVLQTPARESSVTPRAASAAQWKRPKPLQLYKLRLQLLGHLTGLTSGRGSRP